ncbi:MAG TPA: CDP-alcohol phosphatidyltransferase family protein [Kofleriaceae bacterium]|nr:CDP-alcohol phosphatidyltransferase family protein [Kofleriaceae bacterium]
MSAETATWVVECPPGSSVPGTRLCGMSLVERHVREARRAGAARVLVRAGDEQVAGLDPAGLGFERLAAGAPLPDGARVVRGDELAGVRITDAASRRRAERALMETCRRPYDGIADRYLWRALSLRITRLVAATELTPNQVTVVAALLGMLACVLVWHGGTAWVMAGGASLLVGLVLDSVDGELARVRLKFSRLGMVLDNVSDDIVDTLFLAAAGAAAGGTWWWIGVGAAAARAVVALVIYDGASRAGEPGDVMAFRWWFERGQATTAVYGNPLAPLTLVRSIGRHDAYVTLYGAFCLAGWPVGVVLLGGAITAGYFALTCMHLVALARR